MSYYNTGIGGNIPSVLDLTSVFTGFVNDFVHIILGRAQTSFSVATLADDVDPGTYDPITRSWAGEGDLRYRVPLYPIPGERHARERKRNVKILMDNCRRHCVNDDLPCTPAEKTFWVSYRFMKYQLWMVPAGTITPALYIFSRVFHDRLPRVLRGRTMPFVMSFALAEVIADATYPTHQFLSTALRARTPLGDVARAEWARLQSVDIPFYLFSAYEFQHMFDSVPEEYLFGGDIATLCK